MMGAGIVALLMISISCYASGSSLGFNVLEVLDF